MTTIETRNYPSFKNAARSSIETQAKHTPLPWAVFHAELNGNDIIGTVDKSVGFALMQNWSDLPSKEENEANAAFIVKACNLYYDLLDIANKFNEMDNDDVSTIYDIADTLRPLVNAAIAKAEGEETEQAAS